MIRVAVIDDHPIARRGVEQVLTEAGGVDIIAAAAAPAEMAAQLGTGDDGDRYPDVIILDLYHDGDEPCLDAVAELSAATRVLVMSAFGRPTDVLGAVRAGAAGYVTKQSSPAMFVAAVQIVAAGGFYLSSQLADILQTELVTPSSREAVRPVTATGTSELSPREAQALDLIARGFTHAQTATRMGISKATVDTYVERIRAKLQVGNKAELTRAALRHLGGPAST